MAKFIIEFDTETATSNFAIDGQPVDSESASIGCYSYKDCDNKDQRSYYVSFAVKEDTTTTTSYAYSYSTKDGITINLGNSYNLSKAIAKVVENAKTSAKLSHSLQNATAKDPVKIINLSKREAEIKDTPEPQPVYEAGPLNNDRNPYKVQQPDMSKVKA